LQQRRKPSRPDQVEAGSRPSRPASDEARNRARLVKKPGKRHLASNMVAVLADGLLEIAEI
jgi:hypothetical protein